MVRDSGNSQTYSGSHLEGRLPSHVTPHSGSSFSRRPSSAPFSYLDLRFPGTSRVYTDPSPGSTVAVSGTYGPYPPSTLQRSSYPSLSFTTGLRVSRASQSLGYDGEIPDVNYLQPEPPKSKTSHKTSDRVRTVQRKTTVIDNGIWSEKERKSQDMETNSCVGKTFNTLCFVYRPESRNKRKL